MSLTESRKNIERLIEENNFGNVSETILSSLKESIRLCNRNEISESLSKIGGLPFLPSASSWPKDKNGKSLAFLAQIDGADLTGTFAEGTIPSDSLLSFFYDAQEQPWGFDPNDAGSWSVLHHKKSSISLVEEFPLDVVENSKFRERLIEPVEELSLPDIFFFDQQLRDDHWDDFENLYELRGSELDEDDGTSRFLGHPDIIQNDWRDECALVTAGIYCGDGNAYSSEEGKEILKKENDWILLLQIDSDDFTNMMWGDLGRVYFCIRQQDLDAMNFSSVWVILQCF